MLYCCHFSVRLPSDFDDITSIYSMDLERVHEVTIHSYFYYNITVGRPVILQTGQGWSHLALKWFTGSLSLLTMCFTMLVIHLVHMCV